MGISVGFGRTLVKMGKWHFGIGFKVRGGAGLIALCIFGIMNLMWYMLVGCCWITYGFIWLIFVLPIKILVNSSKRKKQKKGNK